MFTNQVILHDARQRQWLCFEHPIHVLTADRLNDVLPLLETVQQQVEHHHYYAAGFLSYEAAPAFDASLLVNPSDRFPLIWFGLYQSPTVIQLPDRAIAPPLSLPWTPSISRRQYGNAIQQIKHYIAEGLTYQVNFSFRLQAPFEADPWLYFTQLMQVQQSLYGAWIQCDDWTICCASPELFFQLNDRTLISRPMKGTTPRGLTYGSDRHLATSLHQSEKNRAENLMIVDMVRNDLGRIAQLGTVEVTELFAVEPFPTLWQMTSQVKCSTNAHLVEIMRALFPCASITGAPKPSTMKIIAELEQAPRHIYTGTIGYLSPYRQAQFNVAIRTVLIDRLRQTAEYGVGGGIVWDSIETDEYDECCTKAKILTQQQPTFSLLESLRWTPINDDASLPDFFDDPGKGLASDWLGSMDLPQNSSSQSSIASPTSPGTYFLLDLHLQRLQESAAYFGFPINLQEVRGQLEAIAQTLPPLLHKVRLVLSKQGEMQVTAEPIRPMPPMDVAIASRPIDSTNVFLYHKTTHRQVYERARHAHPEAGDVLLWNERREVTESCIANLIVEWDGRWYTPPVKCGLLAGTFRAWLLSQGKVQERVIHLDDLAHCSRLFLVNSVRLIWAIARLRIASHSP